MKKLAILTAALWCSFMLTTDAQTLLYQWAFTNASDTTSSIPTSAVTPGTGVLGLRNISGDAIAPGDIFFTNVNSGPPGGPGGLWF